MKQVSPLWIVVLFILPSLTMGCRKHGDSKIHDIRFEVLSDTTVAETVVVQLTKNLSPAGEEIVLNTPQYKVKLPFSVSQKITGYIKDESYNYALTAEVFKTKTLTLRVFIDGKLRKQLNTKRQDFIGEVMVPF
jgi:hypothetical protein